MNLFSCVGLEHEVDERGAERLVLGLLELHEVAAARERRALAGRAGRASSSVPIFSSSSGLVAMIEL